MERFVCLSDIFRSPVRRSAVSTAVQCASDVPPQKNTYSWDIWLKYQDRTDIWSVITIYHIMMCARKKVQRKNWEWCSTHLNQRVAGNRSYVWNHQCSIFGNRDLASTFISWKVVFSSGVWVNKTRPLCGRCINRSRYYQSSQNSPARYNCGTPKRRFHTVKSLLASFPAQDWETKATLNIHGDDLGCLPVLPEIQNNYALTKRQKKRSSLTQ